MRSTAPIPKRSGVDDTPALLWNGYDSTPRPSAETTRQLARGLGWFSIGLGLTQLLAPVRLGRAIGVGDRRPFMQAMGAREVLHGIAVLAPHSPKMGLWSRVVGDVLDTGLLVGALAGPCNDKRRVLGALVMVLPVGVLDLLAARRASRA